MKILSIKQEVIKEAVKIIRNILKEKGWYNDNIREQLGLIEKYNEESV
jgi:hypothetical protein